MKYYELDYQDVLKKLNTSEFGISDKEAEKRLKIDGKNKLKEVKKRSKIKKFLEQFNDLMIIILLLASIISFIISIINKESFTDSIVIIAIVIINAILGFIQELKADKSIESLSKMQITKVKIRRNNCIKILNSEDIVKGDILVLESGDTIPADARIIWQVSLKVDESSLTGESIPVSKSTSALKGDIPLSERNNMIYSGTSIVYGKCHAVVTEIGMNTEFGLIAKSLESEEKEITPLQRKINGISKFLSLIIAIIIFDMFVVGILKGMELTEVIMLAISLAVAAIPEGLPAVITIILSLGMNAMAKRKAIVRKMSSVETLGCTEIICSDKTGTITKNKMTVREIYFDNKLYKDEFFLSENMLIDIMLLNNDTTKVDDNYIGDPTEIALYKFGEKYLNVDTIKDEHQRINEIPFDSDRKMMSTINKFNDKVFLLTKGSFDSIIAKSNKILDQGKIIDLTDEMKENLKSIETSQSEKAYRILAFAYKELDNLDIIDKNLEDDLIFVGMACMIDPPREDVKEAISLCKKAHIKPIMITGDSLDTAKAIAREVGILDNDNEAIIGPDLDKYSKDELKEIVKKYSVYARVSPINKLSIVNAWRNNNKVVAMTGDGVNDAPALKMANIGIGMGITGTEVSKGVSDIILLDDSFSTIVSAVKEGRRIFDNIRNVLVYLLTSNIAEVLIVFIGMLFGVEIFLPIQLLYINLVTDSIPAIALAFEKSDTDIMKRKVRKKDSSFFTKFLIAKITISSVLKFISVLLVYFIGIKYFTIEAASSTAFLTLILSEISFAYSCRNLKHNIIGKKFFDNHYMNKSILILIIIQLLVFLTPIAHLFKITSLSLLQIFYCFLTVIIVFLINELTKEIINLKFKDE